MHRAVPIALCAVLAAATTVHAEETRTSSAAAHRLGGLYRYVGDAAEQTARAEAIDRGIESLFFAIRPIARSRASSATAIAPTCEILLEGRMVRIRTPDRPDYVSPADGSQVRYVYQGDESTLTHRWRGPTLVEHFDQEGEGRINEYTLAEDGRTLKQRVTLYSPALTRPIVYTLTYRR